MTNVQPSADIIKNGRVDFADFAAFAHVWLSDANDAGFDPSVDLCPDGVINYKDLEAFAEDWLGAGGGEAGDYYYHYDGLGSVTAISNAAGAMVETYEYDVYGSFTIRNASGSVLSVSSVKI